MGTRKVLYVNSAGTWGGGEIYLTTLIKGLKKYYGNLFSPFLLSASYKRILELFKRELSGVPIYQTDMRYKDFPKAFKTVGFILKNKKIDILHINGRRGILFAAWWKIMQPDLKVVATIHLPFFSRGENRLKSLFLLSMHILPFRLLDKIIVVSHEILREVRNFFRIPEWKIELIYNGIDPVPFEHYHQNARSLKENFKKEVGIRENEITIIEVARIEKVKGQHFLIKILPNLLRKGFNVKLLFLGSGSYENRLKKLIEKKKITQKVMFLGYKEQEEVIRYLDIADIVALPSLNEGFPLSLVEAMMMAKPVVASKVGEIEKIITDGITGFLIKPGDERELEEKLKLLLENRTLRENIGIAAREWALKHCTLETMIEKVVTRVYGLEGHNKQQKNMVC